jgi:hypothetical protein
MKIASWSVAGIAFGFALVLAGAARAARGDAVSPARDSGRAVDQVEPKRPIETHLWANGGVGYSHVTLQALRATQGAEGVSAEAVELGSSGPAAHLGLGFRLAFFTLGLRAGVTSLTDDSLRDELGDSALWTIDVEAGLRVPGESVEPYFLFGGGYATFGDIGDAFSGAGRGLAADGANLRGGVGVDWFLAPELSVGARGTAELLVLSGGDVALRDLRSSAEDVESESEARQLAREVDRSSSGVGYTITVGPGVHF